MAGCGVRGDGLERDMIDKFGFGCLLAPAAMHISTPERTCSGLGGQQRHRFICGPSLFHLNNPCARIPLTHTH